MNLKEVLLNRAMNVHAPLVVDGRKTVSLRDILDTQVVPHDLRAGEVAAIIGDFDAPSIALLFDLIDRGVTIMPLSEASAAQHQYFLQEGFANAVFRGNSFERLNSKVQPHQLLTQLKDCGHSGLVLFTSGTTGRPKAILHDFHKFLARFATPRKAFRTLNFLLFDHIGGLNTLFHTVYNGGVVVRPMDRSPETICKAIQENDIELLPTTPTFLRMLGMGGWLSPDQLPSLKLITYGTERMDQNTLDTAAAALPDVDFRQTYGMSELGILRVSTQKRDELWIKIGGEGVESKIVDDELILRAQNRMLGYLNAASPFDSEGWYATKDLVELNNEGWLRFTGRKDYIINVGGLKVFPAEVEHAALTFPGIKFAKATGRANPLTGMHVELQCELNEGVEMGRAALADFLASHLPPHARPRRIVFDKIAIGHRCKQI